MESCRFLKSLSVENRPRGSGAAAGVYESGEPDSNNLVRADSENRTKGEICRLRKHRE